MDKNIQNNLDIFLITYNRDKYLESTLEQLFCENSPIKDYEITIIDNNSNDDTANIVKKYQKKYSNLKYKKNKYNIGGNANIARTFEFATKDYIWILCDDDCYCWDAWTEVELAIKDEYDAIVVSSCDYPKVGIANLFAQMTFLPGIIYKTSNIDETVLANMEFNISNMFPHLALAAKIVNDDKRVKIVSSSIVNYKQNEMDLEKTYVRGYKNSELHPLMSNLNYLAGYANSLHMIKNNKLRNIIATKRRFYMSNLNSAKVFFFNNDYYNGSLYNLLCIFCVLNPLNKIRFILNWILFYTLFRIIYFYVDEIYNNENLETVKILKLRLFYFIKTNIFKIKIKEQGVL